jgi:hypothetical protein
MRWINFISALKALIENQAEWKKDYIYDPKKNEFEHRSRVGLKADWTEAWFKL